MPDLAHKPVTVILGPDYNRFIPLKIVIFGRYKEPDAFGGEIGGAGFDPVSHSLIYKQNPDAFWYIGLTDPFQFAQFNTVKIHKSPLLPP